MEGRNDSEVYMYLPKERYNNCCCKHEQHHFSIFVTINRNNIAAHPLPRNGPTQYNQCSVQIFAMIAVPKLLAGFIDAPDTGIPRMDKVT